jgi:hypothetical protein
MADMSARQAGHDWDRHTPVLLFTLLLVPADRADMFLLLLPTGGVLLPLVGAYQQQACLGLVIAGEAPWLISYNLLKPMAATHR